MLLFYSLLALTSLLWWHIYSFYIMEILAILDNNCIFRMEDMIRKYNFTYFANAFLIKKNNKDNIRRNVSCNSTWICIRHFQHWCFIITATQHCFFKGKLNILIWNVDGSKTFFFKDWIGPIDVHLLSTVNNGPQAMRLYCELIAIKSQKFGLP